YLLCFFFSSRRRHTSWPRDWSSDVCSSDLSTFFGVVFVGCPYRARTASVVVVPGVIRPHSAAAAGQAASATMSRPAAAPRTTSWLGGGLRPPSETFPQDRLRRQSRRSEGGYFALEPQRRAVAAWIGAAHERAAAPDDPVGVADPREELGRRLHAVAPPSQRGHDAAGHACLDVGRVRRLV